MNSGKSAIYREDDIRTMIHIYFRPYIAILDGRTLEEIAKAYLPDDVEIGTSFHGSWVQKPYEL